MERTKLLYKSLLEVFHSMPMSEGQFIKNVINKTGGMFHENEIRPHYSNYKKYETIETMVKMPINKGENYD